jgi:hypothetical protein
MSSRDTTTITLLNSLLFCVHVDRVDLEDVSPLDAGDKLDKVRVTIRLVDRRNFERADRNIHAALCAATKSTLMDTDNDRHWKPVTDAYYVASAFLTDGAPPQVRDLWVSKEPAEAATGRGLIIEDVGDELCRAVGSYMRKGQRAILHEEKVSVVELLRAYRLAERPVGTPVTSSS